MFRFLSKCTYIPVFRPLGLPSIIHINFIHIRAMKLLPPENLPDRHLVIGVQFAFCNQLYPISLTPAQLNGFFNSIHFRSSTTSTPLIQALKGMNQHSSQLILAVQFVLCDQIRSVYDPIPLRTLLNLSSISRATLYLYSSPHNISPYNTPATQVHRGYIIRPARPTNVTLSQPLVLEEFTS